MRTLEFDVPSGERYENSVYNPYNGICNREIKVHTLFFEIVLIILDEFLLNLFWPNRFLSAKAC